MNVLIKKPHIFFFGLVPIFIIIGFLSTDKIFDFNIYNNYFTITYFHFHLFSAIFYAMIGINYYSLNWAQKPPKKWLTTVHLILQTISLCLLFTKDNWNWLGKQHYDGILILNDSSNFDFIIALLIFLLSLFIHLINCFSSLLLKKR